MNELTLLDTNGILRQPWVAPERTSAGLGWSDIYVSTQRERPYQETFGAAASHLVILHRSGPVQVRRHQSGRTVSRTVPTGGFFVHPAGKDLTVELGGQLDTVHVYLREQALGDTVDGKDVELVEELGTLDPLLEQLVLALDAAIRGWQPVARTYVDHVVGLLAAQLAVHHSTRGPRLEEDGAGRPVGLGDRQFAEVRELIQSRLHEPIPLATMAAVVGLSVSRFSRQFKARAGVAPHQYLLQLRVDTAARMLRDTDLSIAQVATQCGFSHQEHMTRVLKAQLGVTPAALRRAH